MRKSGPHTIVTSCTRGFRLFELARAHAIHLDPAIFFPPAEMLPFFAQFRSTRREHDQRRRLLVRVRHKPMEREYFFSVKSGSNPSGENGEKHVNILTPSLRRDLSDVDGSPAGQAPGGNFWLDSRICPTNKECPDAPTGARVSPNRVAGSRDRLLVGDKERRRRYGAHRGGLRW